MARKKNSKKIIIDLFGGTGSWSRPYKKAGYDVKVITLPEYDVTKYTVYGGELEFHRVDSPKIYAPMRFPIASVHGILAAPPCTEFSLAKNGSKKPRDFAAGMKNVEAAMRIVWLCRTYGNLKWWALENPTAHLRKFMGDPPFWFYQWEFGMPRYKRTDIWGYYKKPIKPIRKRMTKNNQMKYWSNPRIPEELQHLPISQARAAVRAITPPGFARAFFKANP